MDMDVIIGCGIFLTIVGYLVYAKPWKKEEFITVAVDEQEAKAAVEEVKVEETVVVNVDPVVVMPDPEPVVEEAPVVVIEPEDAPKPKRGRKGKK
jgi:hypothetical protein